MLGQAWARVNIGPAIATLFRQALQLPFINGNDSRMIPNTFEAYQLEAEPWNDVRVNVGYVAGMKPRTSANFEPMSNIASVPQINRGTSFGGFLIGSDQKAFLGYRRVDVGFVQLHLCAGRPHVEICGARGHWGQPLTYDFCFL